MYKNMEMKSYYFLTYPLRGCAFRDVRTRKSKFPRCFGIFKIMSFSLLIWRCHILHDLVKSESDCALCERCTLD